MIKIVIIIFFVRSLILFVCNDERTIDLLKNKKKLKNCLSRFFINKRLWVESLYTVCNVSHYIEKLKYVYRTSKIPEVRLGKLLHRKTKIWMAK